LRRCLSVDRSNGSVSVRAPYEYAPGRSWKLNVIDVAAAAPQQPRVFAPPERLTQIARFFPAFLGRHGKRAQLLSVSGNTTDARFWLLSFMLPTEVVGDPEVRSNHVEESGWLQQLDHRV